MQPGVAAVPATRFPPLPRLGSAAVVAGSASELPVLSGAPAARLAAGRAAGSAKACVAAGFASLSSAGLLSAAVGGLVGSVSAGGLLASAVAGALLASAVVGALLASEALLISAGAGLVSAPLEVRSAALCCSMKSLQVNGKTISPEAVTPIGVQLPGGGPASEDPVR